MNSGQYENIEHSEESEDAVIHQAVRYLIDGEYEATAALLKSQPDLVSEVARQTVEAFFKGGEQDKAAFSKMDSSGVTHLGMFLRYLLQREPLGPQRD